VDYIHNIAVDLEEGFVKGLQMCQEFDCILFLCILQPSNTFSPFVMVDGNVSDFYPWLRSGVFFMGVVRQALEDELSNVFSCLPRYM
jgi:hypothetical protein